MNGLVAENESRFSIYLPLAYLTHLPTDLLWVPYKYRVSPFEPP